MQKSYRRLASLRPSKFQLLGTAKNGEDALSKIAALHPDVVTMDVEMPKMDGLTAVQRIMET